MQNTQVSVKRLIQNKDQTSIIKIFKKWKKCHQYWI